MRELNPSLYSGVTEHNNVYTFPLWNLSGQLVGYFTYLPKSTNTAWGLELLNPEKPYLLVVEGVFDAVKLHNLGVNALAVLANDP